MVITCSKLFLALWFTAILALITEIFCRYLWPQREKRRIVQLFYCLAVACSLLCILGIVELALNRHTVMDFDTLRLEHYEDSPYYLSYRIQNHITSSIITALISLATYMMYHLDLTLVFIFQQEPKTLTRSAIEKKEKRAKVCAIAYSVTYLLTVVLDVAWFFSD